MPDWFKEGGVCMWILTLLMVVGVPVAIAHVVGRRPWSLRVGLGVIAAIVAVAVYGTWSGRARTDRIVAMPGVDRAKVPELRDEGYREASRTLQYGGPMSGVLLALLAVGRIHSWTKPSPG